MHPGHLHLFHQLPCILPLQVESSNPSKMQLEWFSNSLEALKAAAASVLKSFNFPSDYPESESE
jgi:hypothetical protein